MLVVISRRADANLPYHAQCVCSQAPLWDCRFLLATDAACFPSAVRTDLGRCAIVRLRFAAEAAFLMFFLAALRCFVDGIFHTPIRSSSAASMNSSHLKTIELDVIYAARSATDAAPAWRAQLAQQ